MNKWQWDKIEEIKLAETSDVKKSGKSTKNTLHHDGMLKADVRRIITAPVHKGYPKICGMNSKS